jgi:hypothetical protein
MKPRLRPSLASFVELAIAVTLLLNPYNTNGATADEEFNGPFPRNAKKADRKMA